MQKRKLSYCENQMNISSIHKGLYETLALTRVGDHNDCAVGAVLDNLRDDGLEDINIPLHQVEAALSLLLANTSSQHD